MFSIAVQPISNRFSLSLQPPLAMLNKKLFMLLKNNILIKFRKEINHTRQYRRQ